MTFHTLLELMEEAYQNGRPFAVYCLPNQDEVIAFVQKDDNLYEPQPKESGFLMTDFLTDKHYIIPLDKSERYACELTDSSNTLGQFDGAMEGSGKEHYLQMLQQALVEIEQERLSKVVLSRAYHQSLEKFSVAKLIDRLLHSYPNTMRYLWYHPQTGIWCGATPEILVEVWDNTFKTMALAGTRPYDELHSPQWSAKELMEQQFVKDAIADRISNYTSLLKVSKTENHRAGNLVHLKTLFSGVMHKQKKIDEMIDVLHPTPAICGTPTKNAKEFIIANEGYDRSFYTGYLGPRCHLSRETKLFVNLRCMHIADNTATLYAGGGITQGSNPQDEYDETQNKFKTMLHVLAPFV